MNQLAQATSPYLQQHAQQPVHWRCWGEEALAEAKRQDKPILLSIGYSTCHWCHVMARESFEDEAIAAFMNEHFVNIKVDREERPDLDRHYMQACEAIAGSGGWPLQVFLTPGLRPYHAGTYFPPNATGRQPSWMDTLKFAAYNFYQNRRAVEQEASKIEERIARRERPRRPLAKGDFSNATAEYIQQGIAKQFDRQHYGFGSGTKFPNTMALEWLLYYAWYTSDLEACRHLERSVERMLLGGLHDHLGGGFARYTIDPAWRVPHFEKMLYDNALIARLLGKLYRWRRKPEYAAALRSTLDFMQEQWQAPNGGFFSALDAETEGQEGLYYTWDYDTVTELLDAEPGWFCAYFHILPEGNWEGRNVLYATETAGDFARRFGVSEDEVSSYLKEARAQLLQHRQSRPAPNTDTKQLLSWNALTARAFLEGYAALGDCSYLSTAEAILQFIEAELRGAEGFLQHQLGQQQHAFLDGYAYYIAALLDAHRLLQDHSLLQRAARATEQAEKLFGKRQTPLLFYAPRSLADSPVQAMLISEEDTPSANAIMATNYQKLGLLLGRQDWLQRSAAMLQAALPRLMDQPLPHASWGQLLLGQAYHWLEIAIVGEAAHRKAISANGMFLGLHVLIADRESRDAYPLLAGRAQAGKTPIYVCRNFACQQPVDEVKDILTVDR